MRHLLDASTAKIGKKLCSKVKQLTKITNEELKDDGVSFIKAISLFSDFLGDGVLMTWSDTTSCSYRKLQLTYAAATPFFSLQYREASVKIVF